MKGIHTALRPLIESFHGLAAAIGAANKAYDGFKHAEKSGGVTGFLANVAQSGFGFAKSGLETNLFPIQTLQAAFASQKAPSVQTPQQLMKLLGITPGQTFGTLQRQSSLPFGRARPIPAFKSFSLTVPEQNSRPRRRSRRPTRTTSRPRRR